MAVARREGASFAPTGYRPFPLTIDHWLVIGPLVAAVFIVGALVLMS